MRLNLSVNFSKKALLVSFLAIAVVVVSLLAYKHFSNNNPLPAEINAKLSYKAIFPSDSNLVDTSSFKYDPDHKTLSFKVYLNDKTIVFTEQPTPDELASDTNTYYPALGIHPYAQFETNLGTVALTKFWQSGNLEPAGQSAILASGGTFVIANSQNNLTNAEWKQLFDSLKIAQ